MSISDDFIGRDEWHCSEEGGGPDVGHMLTIGENKHLWIGEITKRKWEDAGPDAAELGDDFGFWLILYDGEDVTVLAKFLSPELGRLLVEEIVTALRAAAKVRTSAAGAVKAEPGIEVPDIKLALANMLEVRDDAMGFISNDDERCRTAIEMHDAVQRIHAKLLDQPTLTTRDVTEQVAALPQDVIDLVIAAREYWEISMTSHPDELADALDKALDAFASRVPYENDPAIEAALTGVK